MTPFLRDPDVTLWHGDALEVLRGLPSESVHCVATSPPFYALRDYGVDGQIGLEATPDEWAARLVEVFREARRVLRSDGTCWIECGDSYATNPGNRRGGGETISGGLPHLSGRDKSKASKPKDLLGTPWLLAFALRADDWWLRGCYPWHKPNAMPESAKDRCTTAHSYVFHLSKNARYYFDGEAISEPAAWERWGDQTVPKHEGTATAAGWIPARPRAELRYGRVGAYQNRAMNGSGDGTTPTRKLDPGELPAKHPRSVWSIPTQGYPEAHFATWPEALARRIILAACPEGGTVLDPFVGSGTTCLVARKLQRRAIGIDLSEKYMRMSARRLQQLSLLAEPA